MFGLTALELPACPARLSHQGKVAVVPCQAVQAVFGGAQKVRNSGARIIARSVRSFLAGTSPAVQNHVGFSFISERKDRPYPEAFLEVTQRDLVGLKPSKSGQMHWRPAPTSSAVRSALALRSA
jgi:hypothetical protein